MSERFSGVARYEREAQPSALQELDMLRESFGFEEDNTLAELHDVLLLATGQEHTELRRQLTGMYQDQARTVIDTDPSPNKWYGAAIALAAIRLESGQIADCINDLDDVYYTLGQDLRFENAANGVDAILHRLENLVQ